MKVADPQGVVWTVRRRWLPRYEGRGLRERLRQRRRRRGDRRGDDRTRWYDWLDFGLVDDSLAGIAISVLLVVGVVVLVLLGGPLVLALVDLVLVLVVAAVGVVGRFVFRRPWTVEARSPAGERHEVHVVGWRRAGERVRALAEDLQHGSTIGSDPGSHP